jgi:hypothetical protein
LNRDPRELEDPLPEPNLEPDPEPDPELVLVLEAIVKEENEIEKRCVTKATYAFCTGDTFDACG